MESPPLARYTPQNSKKRVFPGGNSSYMDPDVVEISPPISLNSKSLKQKEVIRNDVIDVDMDEDCGDVMLVDGTIDTNNKGKEVLVNFSSGPSTAENLGSTIGIQSSKQSCDPDSRSLINLDGFSSDLSYGDDEYMDMYYDDLIYDDEYAMLQSHFDNIDIPPGIEAPIPWFPDNKKNPATASSNSTHSTAPLHWDAAGFPPSTDSSQSSWSQESAKTRQKSTSKCSSSFQTQMVAATNALSWSYEKTARTKKKSVASTSPATPTLQPQNGAVNLPSGLEPFTSWGPLKSSHSKRKPAGPGSRTHCNTDFYFASLGGSTGTMSDKKQVGLGIPPEGGTSIPLWQGPPIFNKIAKMNAPIYTSYINPFDAVHNLTEEEAYMPMFPDTSKSQTSATIAGSSRVPSEPSSIWQNYGNEGDVLEKYHLFKKFDTVQDHLDHHYSRSCSSSKQPSKNWAKKIQEEWKILENDLPDKIFVRVYESRMDLLRAVIIGAEGTPYHDGLFFFDFFFPTCYPDVPPHVYYHSGGLRINPNLYNSGKVCLSLLNTWSGNQKEKWIPGVSTMLQVLVSIQGLILNAKPFFNEPGYATMNGLESGEKSSLLYNENTFILSLKTMVYTIRRPPKHFEDLIVGHFRKYAHDIMVACEAYSDGAQVGCLVKGGVQDVDEGDKSCSENFKFTLAGCISMIVNAFTQIGAKDCEKFLSLAQKGNRLGTAPPTPPNYLFYC